jgi:hypothetical protein
MPGTNQHQQTIKHPLVNAIFILILAWSALIHFSHLAKKVTRLTAGQANTRQSVCLELGGSLS